MALFNFLRNNAVDNNNDHNVDDLPAFFYFYCKADEKDKAEKLGNELEKAGYTKDVHFLKGKKGEFDDAWSVTVSKKASELEKELDVIEKGFRELARKYKAEYDGHDIPL